MMNILDTQDKLKNLSQDQLMTEMRMPTGQAPQFLVLSEITRRQKMRESFSLEQGKDETTVAQDAVAAAGMPGQFAGDMAGTMAPQTDTNGNTGAMPQQAMPPQSSPAPQAMSGGGIVALQEGGPVGGSDISSLMTDPTMVLMANRQGMSVQEYYDSLAPEAQAQALARVGGTPADIPTVASVGPLPVDVGEALPVYTPRPANPNPTVGQTFPSTFPAAADPRGPSFSERLGGLGSSALDAANLSASTITDIGNFDPNREFGQSGGALGDLGDVAQRGVAAISETPGALLRQTGELAQTAADVTNSVVDPYAEYFGGFNFGGMGDGPSAMEEAAAAPQANTGTDLARLGPTVAAATAAAQESAPAGTQPAGMDMGTALAAAVMPPSGGAPAQSQGSRAAPSGGGIASMAPQGGGAPSDYEQELIKMLNAREKRAEQDKWMALAEAGMALMSSSQPTFGGALGEAGQAGLGSLRAGTESAEGDRLGLLGAIEQSRMGREQMQLQRQAAAARAASGGSSGDDEITGGSLSAGQNRLLGQYNDAIEGLNNVLNGLVPGTTEAQRLAAADRRDAFVSERDSIIRSLAGVPFGSSGAPAAQLDFDAQ
jgi:hypothetical protein